jgi:hypothetical protein
LHFCSGWLFRRGAAGIRYFIGIKMIGNALE